MSGAISPHHISLIHFLVERLKVLAMRNVGRWGRLAEQGAAGKQTKQTQNSEKNRRPMPRFVVKKRIALKTVSPEQIQLHFSTNQNTMGTKRPSKTKGFLSAE